MYQIPKNMRAFDIDLYFSSTTDIGGLIHQDWPFIRNKSEIEQMDLLLAGIEKSLSLNRFEKMRIFNAELSKFQANELIKVFVDEAAEFKKLVGEEGGNVFDLAVKAHQDWVENLLPMLLQGPEKPDEDDKMKLLNAMMCAAHLEGTPEFP